VYSNQDKLKFKNGITDFFATIFAERKLLRETDIAFPDLMTYSYIKKIEPQNKFRTKRAKLQNKFGTKIAPRQNKFFTKIKFVLSVAHRRFIQSGNAIIDN